jgi:transcriptional regulator with XRE-family HTH domain
MGMHVNDLHVGSIMRRRRKFLGKSQGWIGEKLGVTFSQIQKYENGSNRIGAGRLYTIAFHLRMPMSSFFIGLGNPGGEPQDECENMLKEECEHLLKAFCLIELPEARAAVLDLVRAMAIPISPGGAA